MKYKKNDVLGSDSYDRKVDFVVISYDLGTEIYEAEDPHTNVKHYLRREYVENSQNFRKIGIASLNPFTAGWLVINQETETSTVKKICECGSEKTYGDIGIHAPWCPKYVKGGQ